VTTTFILPGKTLPSESKVFLPIRIGFPIVLRRKFLRSSGKCHGNWFPAPMTLLLATAAIRDKFIAFKAPTMGRKN
jgi:hypothetical protein